MNMLYNYTIEYLNELVYDILVQDKYKNRKEEIRKIYVIITKLYGYQVDILFREG